MAHYAEWYSTSLKLTSNPPKHTHYESVFWADLTALALSLVELHPANPRRSATGAIPMESQTFQAFVKAGPTGVSSPLYTLTLIMAVWFKNGSLLFYS